MASDSSHDRTVRTATQPSLSDETEMDGPPSDTAVTHGVPGGVPAGAAGGDVTKTIDTALPAPTSPMSPIAPNIPTSPSRASVPPSEPRSSRASFSQLDIAADRPARLQMIVALILGLVLVAIPLYLWRRPRAESIAVTQGEGGADPAAAAPIAAPAEDPKPTLGEAKSILCQDPGPKKTAPEQCDHVVEIEKALAKAIEESAGCVPKDAGGGTIQYVADVSFKRKKIDVSTPKETRTMKNVKVTAACQSAVRGRLQSVPLDSINHAHARYKIAITASYSGAVK